MLNMPYSIENALDTLAAQMDGRPHFVRSESRMTAPRNLHGTAIPREMTVRAERSDIRDLLASIRSHTTNPNDHTGELYREIFHRLSPEITQYKHNLDEINRQIYENFIHDEGATGLIIGSDEEAIGRHEIPVTVLDLYPPKEREQDTRIPWICIGGIASGPHQNVALWTALALRGEKVLIIPYPEKVHNKPHDWSERIKQNGNTLALHGEVTNKVLGRLAAEHNITKANFMVHSAGAPLAIGALGRENAPMRIQNLVVADPVGFTHQNLLKIEGAYAFVEGAFNGVKVGDRIRIMKQNDTTLPISLIEFAKLGNLCRKKQITIEQLERLPVEGKMEVWFGGTPDAVVGSRTQRKIRAVFAKAHNLQGKVAFHRVEGAAHAFPVTHAVGFIDHALRAVEGEQLPERLQIEDFPSSYIESLLRRVK